MVELLLIKKVPIYPLIVLQAKSKSGNGVINYFLIICFVLDFFFLVIAHRYGATIPITTLG